MPSQLAITVALLTAPCAGSLLTNVASAGDLVLEGADSLAPETLSAVTCVSGGPVCA